MLIFEEKVLTPLGVGLVRVGNGPGRPRFERRVVDLAELDLSPEECDVDHVERIDVVFDDGVPDKTLAWVAATFPIAGECDSDEGSYSVNVETAHGLLSFAVPDDIGVGRRGAKPWHSIYRRSAPELDPDRSVWCGVFEAPPGTRIPTAFAWKMGAGLSNKTHTSAYWCAERAITLLD